MAQELQKYTAFSSPLGNLAWIHLSFGLYAALMTFTRLMRKLTWGGQDTVSYLDDMLLFHTSLEEHISGVQSMLQTIRKFGLRVRPSKSFIL